MQPSSTKLRLSIFLTSLIAVLVIASTFAGCNKNPENQNGNTPRTLSSPTPSPSPAPTGGKEILPGDTIIVIKDGSVEIEVNTLLCTDKSNPAMRIFECSNIDLDAVTIRNEKSKPPKPCPKATKLSKVSIDGGGGKDIEVQGHVSGLGIPAGVTIRWKIGDYPPCPSDPTKFCGANKVGTVKVDSLYTENCDPTEKCEIWIQKK